jgi:hypothetical protein
VCRATKNIQYRPNYGFTSNKRENVNDGKQAIAQNWYTSLSNTDTSVAAVLASGFPYSVHPCLRLFHETPTMHHNASSRTHNATRILLTSCSLIGKVSSYCCAQVYNSAVEMVAHIMEVFTEYEEHVWRMHKMSRFSYGRR